jgi:hypothetical protein
MEINTPSRPAQCAEIAAFLRRRRPPVCERGHGFGVALISIAA